MSEDTYTLAAAKQILLKQECASEGHRPDSHTATLADRVGWYVCVCGEVTWTPNR